MCSLILCNKFTAKSRPHSSKARILYHGRVSEILQKSNPNKKSAVYFLSLSSFKLLSPV